MGQLVLEGRSDAVVDDVIAVATFTVTVPSVTLPVPTVGSSVDSVGLKLGLRLGDSEGDDDGASECGASSSSVETPTSNTLVTSGLRAFNSFAPASAGCPSLIRAAKGLASASLLLLLS